MSSQKTFILLILVGSIFISIIVSTQAQEGPGKRPLTATEMGVPPNRPTLTPEPTAFAPPIPTSVQWASPEEAAQGELPFMLDGIRMRLKDFAFKDETELDNVIIGTPAAEYTVDWTKIKQSQDFSESVINFLVDQQTWQYPLLVKGQPRADLTVAYFEGRWQVVSVGGPIYAPGMLGILRSLNADPIDGKSRLSVKLINIKEYATYLALIERNGKQRIVVLGSGLKSMEPFKALYHGASTSYDHRTGIVVDYDPKVILDVLKQQYQENAQTQPTTTVSDVVPTVQTTSTP